MKKEIYFSWHANRLHESYPVSILYTSSNSSHGLCLISFVVREVVTCVCSMKYVFLMRNILLYLI